MKWRFENYMLDSEDAALWRDGERLELRPKTFEVLHHLIEHAGELVRKDALLEAIWGDRYVVEGVLTTSMSELRKLFGESGKEPRFIATVYRRGYRFIAPVEHSNVQTPPSAPVAEPVPATADLPHRRLPKPRFFVGRDAMCRQLKERLCHNPDCRLLSLNGPGGIGKTSLALKVANDIVGQQLGFADGIVFLSLQSLNPADHVLTSVALAMGLQLSGAKTVDEQLVQHVGNREILLILDSFEHLLDQAPEVAGLLERCPGLKMLVTTREVLNTPNEWFQPVGGLTIDTTGESEAVRLFAAAASRNQPAFDLAEKLPQVLRICKLVDGMPLALELAASWLKMLSMDEVADEIERNLDILEDQQSGADTRHQSIRAVLNESWQRLTESEQQLLMRLSVFRGGADREAVTHVIGAGLPMLSRLVNKSLLYTTRARRYRMHDLIRQFAASELDKLPAIAGDAASRHAMYFLQSLGEQIDALRGAEQGVACRMIQIEFDNIRSAWRWAIITGEESLIKAAIRPLALFCDLQGLFHEGLNLLETARAMIVQGAEGEHSGTVRKLDTRRAILKFRLCRYAEAKEIFERVLNETAHLRERALIMRFLGDFHFSHAELVKPDEAHDYLHRCLALGDELDDIHLKAECLRELAILHFNLLSEFDAGTNYAEQSLVLARECGRPDLIASTLDVVAWTLNHKGDYGRAESLWREMRDLSEASGYPGPVAQAINWLGWSAWSHGGERLNQAYDLFRDALQRFQQLGDRANEAMTCADLATVCLEQQKYTEGLNLTRHGIRIASEIGREDHLVYNLYVKGAIECGQGSPESARADLSRALIMAWEQDEQTNKPVMLYYFAMLLVSEHRQDSNPEALRLAGSLLQIVIGQPATWQAFRQRAEAMLAEDFFRSADTLLEQPMQKEVEAIMASAPDILLG